MIVVMFSQLQKNYVKKYIVGWQAGLFAFKLFGRTASQL